MRRITVHGTRKTCGTLLAALDVHPRVAMQILRHSRISVTMEIYTEATSDGHARRAQAAWRGRLEPADAGGEGDDAPREADDGEDERPRMSGATGAGPRERFPWPDRCTLLLYAPPCGVPNGAFPLVGDTGIEPVTSSAGTRRSPAEPIARCRTGSRPFPLGRADRPRRSIA